MRYMTWPVTRDHYLINVEFSDVEANFVVIGAIFDQGLYEEESKFSRFSICIRCDSRQFSALWRFECHKSLALIVFPSHQRNEMPNWLGCELFSESNNIKTTSSSCSSRARYIDRLPRLPRLTTWENPLICDWSIGCPRDLTKWISELGLIVLYLWTLIGYFDF